MNAGELLDLFRKDVMDFTAPYFWSDAEIYAYMNDAYYMFVRLIGGVPDFLNDNVCLLTAETGEKFVDLHPSILVIRTASLEPTGDQIRIINAQDVESLNDEDFGMLRRLNQSTTTGKVKYLVIGQQPDIGQWVNIPDQDYSVRLLVDRLPTAVISTANQKFSDVKSHHHIHFLKWMKHLAYNKQDSEAFNKTKSDQMKAEFEQYCYFAKTEKDRYKHKVRVVRYGGL